jgi:hypothetical protein
VAHNIAFTRKGEKPTAYDESGNWVKLATVDEELCAHLGVECHPTRFYAGWYDFHGDLFALGYTYAEVRAKIAELQLDPDSEFLRTIAFQILDFLEATYDVHAWRTSGFASR